MAETIKCPQCNHDVAEQSVKCLYCGYQLRDPAELRDTASECPNCSAPIDAAAGSAPVTCSYCGRQVTPIETYSPPQKTEAKPEGDDVRSLLQSIDVKSMGGDPAQILAVLASKGVDVPSPAAMLSEPESGLDRFVKKRALSKEGDGNSKFGCFLAIIVGILVLAVMVFVMVVPNLERSKRRERIFEDEPITTPVESPTPASPD